MSAPHRCHTCHHRPRPRVTNQMTKPDKNTGETHTKKAPCGCQCHA